MIIFILFANPWIWKIGIIDPILFIVLIITTFFLYLLTFKKKKLYWVVIPFFLIIALFQWKITTPQSLTLLDNDEQRIREERIKYYAPSEHYVRVIFKRLDLVNFLEGDFSTASKRIQRNFFETVDPNVYFFGGHPRERVWASDFEKFPYIFIFPFFYGLYFFLLRRNYLHYFIFFSSIILLSIVGHINSLGSFILFPVVVVLISEGLVRLANLKSKIPGKTVKPVFITTFILIFLSIVQTFVYAN